MKDVKYKDSDWQSLTEGIVQLTSSGLFEWITEADKISDDAKDSCDTYDVDCAIAIDTASNTTYDELQHRFTLLQQAIQHIPDTLSADIDYPFYNELDSVLEKMSNMNIMGYETMARGSFSNGVNSAGVPTSKMKVTLEDILGNSSPLSDYLRVEYNEKKERLGDVSYEDYQKMAFADTSFDYYSKGEKIKDLGVTLVINGAIIAVGAMLPWPIMVALGFASAGKNGYDAITGKDLFTGKELTAGDRILRGLSGIADLALSAYGTYKGVQAIKGTNKVVAVDKIDDVVEGGKNASEVEKGLELSDNVRELMGAGEYSQALDFHYEDLIRRQTGGISQNIQGREIDSVTDTLLIQAKRSYTALEKPKNFFSKSTRKQIKETARIATETGRQGEYWFKYGCHPNVRKYIESKGLKVIEGLGRN